MYKKRQRRKYIMIGLCMIMLMMAVGYATFYSKLKISGTSTVTSNWDIEITSITKSQVNGNIEEKVEPSFTKDSAIFSVGLEKPGDYIYYKIGVTNKGNIAAIATLGNLTCTESNAISCGAYADSNVSDIGNNTDLTSRRLIIDSNETEYYNVWVKYNPDITNQPDVTNVELKLELTYKQSDVGITHKTEDNCYTGKVLENGTLEITDYDETCGSEVVIPEEIDGYTVTQIADGRWDDTLKKNLGPFVNKNLTSVVIPNTITYIGTNSFINNAINNLILGINVKKIATEAFYSNQLTKIQIPSSVVEIGQNAFANNKITEIDLPTNIKKIDGGAFSNNNLSGDKAFIYGRKNDGTIDYTKLNSYAGNNTNDIVIPSSIETIDASAFRGIYCTKLNIPSTVKTLNNYAFWGALIKQIYLNEGLEQINDYAFSTTLITSINIPNSVIKIGNYAFKNSKLQTVTIGSGIETIGTGAFQYQNVNGTIYNPITSITINKAPNSVQGYPWGATSAQINWTGSN